MVIEPGRVAVSQATTGAGPRWLSLPLPGPDRNPILAFIGFSAAGRDGEGPWGAPCHERALRAWGEKVANRILATVNSPLAQPPRGRTVGDPSATDRLIRQVRVSDSPERFQRLATTVVRDSLHVEAAVWVPGSHREQVIIGGGIESIPVATFRNVVGEIGAETIWISNSPSSPWCAGFANLAIVAAPESAGWLIVANTRDGRALGPDIELMRTVASLIAAQRANARTYADLKELLFGVVRALTSAIDAKDRYTSGHSERVARIAVRLGEELRLSPKERGDLYLMGLLHDVGKIGIHDELLKKPGKLSPEEYRQIQDHVKIGVYILSDLKKLSHLLPGVAHHHERVDGKGYPSGLAGKEIPLAARILAVADAYDAMSSTRPYRERRRPDEIESILRKGAGTQWDKDVVDALFHSVSDIERIRQKGVGDSLQRVVEDTLGPSGNGRASRQSSDPPG
jgi:hypothetical protein